jgi:hypothetical protein
MKKGLIFRDECHSENDLLNQDMADVIRNALDAPDLVDLRMRFQVRGTHCQSNIAS